MCHVSLSGLWLAGVCHVTRILPSDWLMSQVCVMFPTDLLRCAKHEMCQPAYNVSNASYMPTSLTIYSLISVVNDNAGVIHELYINLQLIMIEQIWDSFTICHVIHCTLARIIT